MINMKHRKLRGGRVDAKRKVIRERKKKAEKEKKKKRKNMKKKAQPRLCVWVG